MCGIVAVFNDNQAEEIANEGLKKIRHRGRDAKRIISGKKFAVGHCLHWITGSKIVQPLQGNGIFAADCEIYNWKELCKKFGIQAENDAELLFRLLENAKSWKERIKILDIVDGVYAFVYALNGKVLIARDIVGVKPLVFIKTGTKFAVASEKKALKELEAKWNSCLEHLHPRHIIIFDIKSGKIKDIRRKFIEINEVDKDLKKIVNELDKKISNAVLKRIPEQKLALLFSGGLDSSLLAHYTLNVNAKVEAFVAGIRKEGWKPAVDIEKAEKIAAELGIKLNKVEIDIEKAENEMVKVAKAIESPNVMKNSVALAVHLCAKRAYEKGFKVIFSGSGSDEIFAGYRRSKEGDINRECYSQLIKMYDRDLYRDDLAAMHLSLIHI